MSILDKIFNTLTYPATIAPGAVGRMMVEKKDPITAIKESLSANVTDQRQDSWEDVLEELGMQPGIGRTVAGLAADIAGDPLTYVGGLGIARRGAQGLAKLAQPLRKAVVASPIGKAFSYGHEAPEAVRETWKLFGTERRALRDNTLEQVNQLFKGLPVDTRMAAAGVFDTGGLKALKGDPTEPAFKGVKKLLDDLHVREVAAGTQDPTKKLQNYLPYVLKQKEEAATVAPMFGVSGKFAKPRHITSWDQGVKAGLIEPDPLSALYARTWTGERALKNLDFIKQVVAQHGVSPADIKAAGGTILKGKQVTDTGLRRLQIDLPKTPGMKALKKQFNERYLPEDIASFLEKQVPKIRDEHELGNLFVRANRAWKGLVTATPNFHILNVLGNMWNSWLGGSTPADLVRWNRFRKGTEGIGNLSKQQVDDLMHKYGLTGGSGTQIAEVMSSPEAKRKLEEAAKRFEKLGPVAGRVARYMRHPAIQSRKLAGIIENTSRQSLFQSELRKGKTPEEALKTVKRYMFDYGELTDFEKKLRDYPFPFYTWSRKNIPLQVQEIVAQPHKFTSAAHVTDAFLDRPAERLGKDYVAPEDRPEWIREEGMKQLPIVGKEGEKYFTTLRLPYQDLNEIRDPLRFALNMLTPFLKIPIEMALNKQAFNQAPIYQHDISEPRKAPEILKTLGLTREYKGRDVAPAWQAYLARQIPMTTMAGRFGAAGEGTVGEGDVMDALPHILGLMALPTVAQTPRELGQSRYYERRDEREAERKRRIMQNLYSR